MDAKKEEWLRANLRVVLFTGNYNYIRDGVAVTLNKLVAFLESRGIDVVVVTPTTQTPAFEPCGRMISVPSIPAPGRGEYRGAIGLPRSVRRQIDAFAPTLFHVAVPDMLGFRALQFARRRGVPAVASYHTRYQTYFRYYGLGLLEPLWRRYTAFFYGRCRQLYVPSEAIGDVLKSEGVRTEIRVWSRGVDAERYHPRNRSDAWRKEIGVGDEVLVTYVGRLVREKNMAGLTRAFAALNAEGSGCRTIIVGDGPEEKKVRAALPGTIFTGFLYDADLARAYASSDLFFFPSTTETFGNVTAEAMASGLPAVCADAPNSRSLVIPGETGLLVDPGKTENFVGPLMALASDAGLRQRMAAAARTHVVENFGTDGVMRRILDYYYDALNERAQSRPEEAARASRSSPRADGGKA